MSALSGIRGLYPMSMTIVPISDMTSVMSVSSAKKPVKKGQWLRMTRGHFKGDLARVTEVLEDGMKCIIQCVPRFHLLSPTQIKPEDAKAKRKIRPAKKFFNAIDVTNSGGHVSSGRMPGFMDYYDTYDGNFYDREGYMVKQMIVGTTVVACTKATAPNLEELQEFRKKSSADVDGEGFGSNDNEQSLLDELSDLQRTFSSGQAKERSNHGIAMGDTVKVVEGDLVGMIGKVVYIDDNTVKIDPKGYTDVDADLGEVEFLVDQVRKHLTVGTHVKVVDGRYVDETGVVLAVEVFEGESTAILLTDLTAKEVSVKVSHLQESAEVSTGQSVLQGYELYDLVSLTGGVNEVGVIVRVGKEDFRVILATGARRDVRPEELRGKRNTSSFRAVALDFSGNQVRVGDAINIIDGEHKGKAATIKHVHRSQLFLHSQVKVDDGGIFTARAKSCSLLAGSKQKSGQIHVVTQKVGSRARQKDDQLLGKTVQIQSGKWKGYMGVVCLSTDTHYSVELHSRLKKVSVEKIKCRNIGDKFGSLAEDGSSRSAAGGALGGGYTPFMGAATPQMGDQTPMNGSATPSGHGAHMTPLNAGGYGSYDNDQENVWLPGDVDSISASSPDASKDSSAAVTDGTVDSSPVHSADWTPTSDLSNPAENDGEPSWTPQTSSSAGGATPSSDSFTPMSTGSSTMTPMATPGAEASNYDWFVERVYVNLVNDTSEAYILKSVNKLAGNAQATGENTFTDKIISISDISGRVMPENEDLVLVYQGALSGSEGTLVCIDGNDAIFKNDDGDYKIVEVGDVAKIGSK